MSLLWTGCGKPGSPKDEEYPGNLGQFPGASGGGESPILWRFWIISSLKRRNPSRNGPVRSRSRSPVSQSRKLWMISTPPSSPSIDKRQIDELATMRFLENGENVVFLHRQPFAVAVLIPWIHIIVVVLPILRSGVVRRINIQFTFPV